ncbi:MAG: c-type cytochrome [Chloracidobacterium sp.]|uniref:C-type cytochrome n=1 Tax=Chloracidobacterium validum TaxID=2821543 RepID=A0ABX8B8S5_9BACT|nr:c-type cytochrome [Chloracidobacterium validum]QUW03341.1 c-type cytochrome [Chloracidobacterium validum]
MLRSACHLTVLALFSLVTLTGDRLATGWRGIRVTSVSDEATSKRLARGKRLYLGAGACVACHGTDGRPTVPDAPDFTDTAWQRKHTDADIAQAIANGKGTMPAFKGSAADVEALTAYVRSFAK